MSLAFDLGTSGKAPDLESFLDLDQAVLDALPIGVYACDGDGRILRVNRKAVELWGRNPRLRDSAERYCGAFHRETLSGEVIAADRTPMASAVQYGEAFDGAEAVVENPDGRRWVARVNVAPLRGAHGEVVGAVNCFQDVTREHDMKQALERQQRNFDLAMVASRMGTWRYTLADNICVYDENAQKLYGLTEARFLHDEAGVRDKFHPDDMDLMWRRVATALDPAGDGRYDVEYRVKQQDGSWRWLSAWGLVEFAGEGAERKPVVIAGASRDLTERKKAEELQRLLVGELTHRVKNTLAMVQAIVHQSLYGANDIATAHQAIDGRIVSMGRAHDLLIDSSWAGANVAVVVERVLGPFAAGQIGFDGPSFDVSSKHVLALSLALHELATNAAKYGALSRPEGRVAVSWQAANGELVVDWRETGGPAVAIPERRGFGRQLLEEVLFRDLGGETRLEWASDGIRWSLRTALAPQ